ncbi:MAG: electron transfer flavoprotein subunit alpha/FixB family protein [Anaerolineales bacterium]|nr:electron transfer flavoprotein subunit alpha/FixB family protein [Anaerolineales bacterium]
MEKNPVWVFAERDSKGLLPVSLELVGCGRGLADELNTSLEVILLGEDLGEYTPKLIASGADQVYVWDDEQLACYQAELYVELIVSHAAMVEPSIFLIGSTWVGIELAPLVAARLETGLTAHCIDLLLTPDGLLDQRVPAYGGVLSILCPEKRPQMATAAQGVFPIPDLNDERPGEVEFLDVPKSFKTRMENLEIVSEELEGVPLESASFIVAGGAGARDEAGWQQIVNLASALNAGLGSTRPAVDEGWTTLDTMIGQSGKMVSPEVYIGIGLSGEQQHMVGIVGAKVMMAINNDPKAPIFDQVDIGVVDDCREFLPVLLDRIKAYREERGSV